MWDHRPTRMNINIFTWIWKRIQISQSHIQLCRALGAYQMKPYTPALLLTVCAWLVYITFGLALLMNLNRFLFSFHAGNFSVIKWTIFCFVLARSLSHTLSFHCTFQFPFRFDSGWAAFETYITVKWFFCLLIFLFSSLKLLHSLSISSQIDYFHYVLFVANSMKHAE